MMSPTRAVSTLRRGATDARWEHAFGRPGELVIAKGPPENFDFVPLAQVSAARLFNACIVS
jgi:hypothetical protein